MSSNSYPDDAFCPILHTVMVNPYTDNQGISYEYSAIMQWLNSGHSPLSLTFGCGVIFFCISPGSFLKSFKAAFIYRNLFFIQLFPLIPG